MVAWVVEVEPKTKEIKKKNSRLQVISKMRGRRSRWKERKVGKK